MLLLLTSIIYSCNDNRIFESNQSIENNQWTYDNPIVFDVEIQDTSVRYDVYVNIRHTKEYEYSNLWMKIQTTFPNAEKVETPVNLPMADDDGKWFGSGLGSVLSTKLLIQEKAIFPEIGTYKLELFQNMRVNPVEEIMDVGLEIEKSE